MILNLSLRSTKSRISEQIESKSPKSKSLTVMEGRTSQNRKTHSEEDLLIAVLAIDSSQVEKLVKHCNGTFRGLGSLFSGVR